MNKMEELIGNAEAMGEYLKWRELPMTKAVVAAVQGYLMTTMLPDPFAAGVSPNASWITERLALTERHRAGIAQCLAIIMKLDEFKAKTREMPEDDYKADFAANN